VTSPHKYILFSDNPRTGAVTDVTTILINYLFKNKQSITKWRKDKKLYQISWTDRNQKPDKSRPLNYLEISKFIRENGFITKEHFNLPLIDCFWLDFTLDFKIDWHMFDHTAPQGLTIHDGIAQQQYGNNYPISPKLNREGHSYTTLQPQLLHRIIKLRNELVERSDLALTDDWFFDLRTLINDTVSIVEITLNQFYNKAEYDPLPHWKFDKLKIGDKHGRRFEDKLSWVYKISGQHLGAESYLPNVNKLRELRNHMMHFDPPSLVIPIEEATIWLNYVIDVGYLLIKIRQAIGAEVSLQLMNFILQKEAIFTPEDRFKSRLPFVKGEDYSSSTW
jgi:hypothetical protein